MQTPDDEENAYPKPAVSLRRRKFIFVLIVLFFMAIVLRSVLRETSMSLQYGMARIRVGDQKVYVKARTCGINCRPELWISRNSDRCRPPDPATDYLGEYNTLLYAVQGQTLFLVAESQAFRAPQSANWLDLHFLPPYGHAADAYPLRYLQFNDAIAKPRVPGEQIDLDTCVRAFGHTWN